MKKEVFQGPRLHSVPAHALRQLVYKLLRRWAQEHQQELAFDPVVPAYDLMARRMLIWGFYEREYLDTLMHFLAFARDRMQSGICIDAGANIGNHSLYFSRHFSKVIAFEPNPEVLEILRINARKAGNVEVVPKGLGREPGSGVMDAPRGNLGAGRVVAAHAEHAGRASNAQDPASAAATASPVEIIRLDDFLATRKAEADRVVLLKMDTEGFERSILEGSTQLLRKSKPVVIFEVHAEALQDPARSPIPVLEELGYQFHIWQRPFRLGQSKPAKLLSKLIQLFAGRRLLLVPVSATDIPVRNHRFIVAMHPDMSSQDQQLQCC